jgi:hypothetical protein
MTKRGRKSAAELSVVRINAGPQRPDPPQELSAAEAEVWRMTTSALRADWFTAETHPLLAAYCCHVVNARRIEELLRKTDLNRDLPRFNRLTAMHFRETAVIMRLSTKMRLTPQSSWDRKTNKHDLSAGHPKPWEI